MIFRVNSGSMELFHHQPGIGRDKRSAGISLAVNEPCMAMEPVWNSSTIHSTVPIRSVMTTEVNRWTTFVNTKVRAIRRYLREKELDRDFLNSSLHGKHLVPKQCDLLSQCWARTLCVPTWIYRWNVRNSARWMYDNTLCTWRKV